MPSRKCRRRRRRRGHRRITAARVAPNVMRYFLEEIQMWRDGREKIQMWRYLGDLSHLSHLDREEEYHALSRPLKLHLGY